MRNFFMCLLGCAVMQCTIWADMNKPVHREFLRKKCEDPVIFVPMGVYFIVSMLALPLAILVLLLVLITYIAFLLLFAAYSALFTTAGQQHSPPPGFMPVEFYVLHLFSLIFLHVLLFGSVLCAVGGVFFVLLGMLVFVLFYNQ